MDQQPTGKKKEIIAALAVLIVIVAIVAAVSLTSKKNTTSSSTTANNTPSTSQNTSDTSTPSTSAPTSTAPTANTSGYKDGSYNATGSYDTPGGTESIAIDVTLKDGVVTATSAQASGNNHDSREYQNAFVSGYKQLVVGKNINSISLSRVSGSSLTSQGFNDALAQIKSEAKQNA